MFALLTFLLLDLFLVKKCLSQTYFFNPNTFFPFITSPLDSAGTAQASSYHCDSLALHGKKYKTSRILIVNFSLRLSLTPLVPISISPRMVWGQRLPITLTQGEFSRTFFFFSLISNSDSTCPHSDSLFSRRSHFFSTQELVFQIGLLASTSAPLPSPPLFQYERFSACH